MKEERIESKSQKKEPVKLDTIETAEWGTKDPKLRKIRCFSEPENCE